MEGAQVLANHASTNVPTQIYINPKFLGNPAAAAAQGISIAQSTHSSPTQPHALDSYSHLTAQEFHEPNTLVAEPLADTKIHTRTKIIKPSVQLINDTVRLKPQPIVNKIESTKSLIKIGSKKLVRVPAVKSTFAKTTKTIPKLRRPLQTKYKIVKEQTTFKIDRRSAKAKLDSITRKIVPIVTSRKLWINESLMPTKTIKK